MCGIGGILRVFPPGVTPPPHLEAIPEAWLDVLDDSIKHRGPDGQGRFRDRVVRADGCTVDVAFVHRRMSVLDLEGGAQPMVARARFAGEAAADRSAPSLRFLAAVGEALESGATPRDGREFRLPALFQGSPTEAVAYSPLGADEAALAVVFNGCIYNHRELRKELEGKGHRFVTDHSDTEVLLHGWREWGSRVASRADGMFAFALWDRREGSLLLSRDDFGEKPLHLHHVGRAEGWINVFCSIAVLASGLVGELGESVPALAGACKVLDWVRMGWAPSAPVPGSYSVPAGASYFYHRGVERLPDSASAEAMQELIPPTLIRQGEAKHGLRGDPRFRLRDATAQEVEQTLQRAVESRLEADVPLGCFLSGGIDSGLVAAFARRKLGALRTFTVKMPHPTYDESIQAAATATALGTEHFTIPCRADPSGDLVELIQALGLPFGDSSLLPAYWVSRAAREHVKVALSGDGGDELFAGYDRYLAARWQGLPVPFASLLGKLAGAGAHPKSMRSKLARVLEANAGLGFWDIVSVFPADLLDRLIAPDGQDPARAWYRANRIESAEYAMSFDLNNYLPEDLLRKTDTASMQVALEVRCPFLAPELVQLAEHATLRSLLPSGQRKGLLRAVARKYLPTEIVDRPKMGFAIPVGEWFRSDFGGMRTLLLDMLHSGDPFPSDLLGLELNQGFIAQMEREHMEGRRDHSQRLYMLLVLAIWCRWMRSLPRESRGKAGV